MRVSLPIVTLAAAAIAAAQNALGTKGYSNISTGAFNLELDGATQVATGLNAMAGDNAGSSDFNFLLPTPGRTQDGNYVSPNATASLFMSSPLGDSFSETFNYASVYRARMPGRTSRLTRSARLQ